MTSIHQTIAVVTTGLDVVDSAVKIGLGALIAGVVSLVTIKLNSGHERQRELRRRRLDIIQQCAVDFERQCQVFIRLFASYSVITLHGKNSEADVNHLNGLLDEVSVALLELHRIEALLTTIGAENASACVGAYRLRAADLQSASLHPSLSPRPDIGAYTKLHHAAGQQRAKYYDALKDAFANLA